MQRRHFEAIARALREARPERNEYQGEGSTERFHAALAAWADTVRLIMMTLSDFNPSFDRDRFYKACGYDRFSKAGGYE